MHVGNQSSQMFDNLPHTHVVLLTWYFELSDWTNYYYYFFLKDGMTFCNRKLDKVIMSTIIRIITWKLSIEKHTYISTVAKSTLIVASVDAG